VTHQSDQGAKDGLAAKLKTQLLCLLGVSLIVQVKTVSGQQLLERITLNPNVMT
jgi:hypothetical protein